MKRLFVLLGSVMLMSTLALPLFAYSPAHIRGPHMRGHWGAYRGCCAEYERIYGNVSEEQRSKLRELDRKFYHETEQLLNEITDLSQELHTILNKTDPDHEEAKTLQRRLSELRAKMDEKQLFYTIEKRTIIPEIRSKHTYEWGYKHHKRGYRSGMGYGPGSCWQ